MSGIMEKTKEAFHNAADSTKEFFHHAGEKLEGDKRTKCETHCSRREMKELTKQAVAETGAPVSDLGCKAQITKIEKA